MTIKRVCQHPGTDTMSSSIGSYGGWGNMVFLYHQGWPNHRSDPQVFYRYIELKCRLPAKEKIHKGCLLCRGQSLCGTV